jgi:hypothetical protein
VTLNASNSSGSSTATLVLNVSAAPNITVASSNNNVCSGNPVTISASGASIYTWSNNTTGSSITVSPTSTTTYSVTGTDQSGCSSTQTITINVNQVTPANISVINDTICITNSPQILSGTPTGGTFFGTGVINGNFDPQISGAGNFTIGYTYTDNNSCSDSATAQMTVELCTSLNDLILSDVKIFPNPAQNNFSINITSNENSKMNVTLLDVRGREIMQTQRILTPGNNLEIFNISEIESGVYFINVQVGEKIYRTKLVKEN